MTNLSSLSIFPFLTESYVLFFFLSVHQSWLHTSFTRSADHNNFPLSPRGCKRPHHTHQWKQMLLLAHKIGLILLSLECKRHHLTHRGDSYFFILVHHFINLKQWSAETYPYNDKAKFYTQFNSFVKFLSDFSLLENWIYKCYEIHLLFH